MEILVQNDRTFRACPRRLLSFFKSHTRFSPPIETRAQDASPIQLKPAFVRSPASRKGLNGTKPVPPIPRGASAPEKAEFSSRGHKIEEPEAIWLNERDGRLAIDLSELDINEKELDEEEVGVGGFSYYFMPSPRSFSYRDFMQSNSAEMFCLKKRRLCVCVGGERLLSV